MQATVQDRLLQLNREFYQTFAREFSETRVRVQPGVLKALEGLDPEASLLDLGCGNGSLAIELAARGHRGRYVGLDSTAALLEIARRRSGHPYASFYLRDLSQAGWGQGIGRGFDAAFAFAVLHHLPGERLRTRLLKQVHGRIEEGGRLTLSAWNFLSSERLRARLVPWEEAGISADQVDEGDYLLDWRRGGYGLRYVHAFDEQALSRLARDSGFRVVRTYYADGENGRLGLYQVWRPVSQQEGAGP